jgi:hypothetical protein
MSMKVFLRTLAWLFLAMNLGCQSTGRPTAQSVSRGGNLGELVQDLKARATNGEAKAQTELGACYEEGRGVAQDLVEAARWYRKAADQGNAAAQNRLAGCYKTGRGVDRDAVEAMNWFRKSAAQGNPEAQTFLLGLAYFQGGLETNKHAEAFKWLRKSAKQGNALAQAFLGLAYYEGRGVDRDYGKAARWFRQGAEQGNAQAETSLGVACYHGQGLALDYAQSVKWFRKAAEQGDAEGQRFLGACYNSGQGVPHEDAAEAAKWFRQAAEQGDAEAQASLGLAYRQGRGVNRDYAQAYRWLDRAAVQGDTNAVSTCEELSRLMTPEQLAEAGAVSRRGLTRFDRRIIDAHQQRYSMSCIPSSVEMVLKLLGRVPASYYDQQTAWKEKADGSFHDFDGKLIAGVTFHQQFTMARNSEFPLAELFARIDHELQAGRFVIVGLASPGGGWHNWVIYDEDTGGEFLAISKSDKWKTVEERHVKQVVAKMQGTDIGTYEAKP